MQRAPTNTMDEQWAFALQHNPYAQSVAFAPSSSTPMVETLDNVPVDYQYCFQVHPSFTYAQCQLIWETQLSFAYPATFPTENQSIGIDEACSITRVSNLDEAKAWNQEIPGAYLHDHNSDPEIDFDGDEVINQEIL
jgi:hypothetical protein